MTATTSDLCDVCVILCVHHKKPRAGEMTTQRDRILQMLTDSGDLGVCATRFLSTFMPRYASVIHRLRNQGYVIVTEPCQYQSHVHTSPQVQYRLIQENGRLF